MLPTTTNLDSLSDRQVIDRVLSGETGLFELLIKRNNASLYRVGRSYGFNHQDTEDAMQETYIHAYLNLSKFENRASFKTWAVKIMLNQCHHKAAKFSFSKEKANEFTRSENITPMYASNSGTDKIIINRELKNILENAILQIPADYRMVFSLREMNGLSTAETANALDISQSNVKVRLNRAKALLRKQIESVYSGEEVFEYHLTYCDGMANRVMNIIKRMN
jgi:RNA polymerase sigma factor (sigma-70 family)